MVQLSFGNINLVEVRVDQVRLIDGLTPPAVVDSMADYVEILLGFMPVA